jgi:hypothetical protein
MNLPLSDLIALQSTLPRQIQFRKLEETHMQGEMSIAEAANNALQQVADRSPRRAGRIASPLGAQSLIKELLTERGTCSRKDVTAYCIEKNPALTQSKVDSAGEFLVKNGFLTKCNGAWKRA